MSLLAHTHPRSAAEIIDATFRFYRSHFLQLLVLGALLLAPPVLLAAVAPPGMGRVIELAGNLLYPVCQAAVTLLVAAALERDRVLSAGEALGELGKRTFEVIGVAIVAGILMMLGLLLLVIPGVLVIVWTMVVVPVVVIEGLAGWPAIKRSRELARGQFRHVLGTAFLAWFIVIMLVMGGGIAVGLAFGAPGESDRMADMIAGLVMIPLFPLVGVATALLYYDLRVRSEGADVVAMFEQLPAVETEPGIP